jgi:hypothetical protein
MENTLPLPTVQDRYIAQERRAFLAAEIIPDAYAIADEIDNATALHSDQVLVERMKDITAKLRAFRGFKIRI